MLIDRTHRKWAVISTAIFVVATLSYISYASSTPKGPTGGSFMGLLYGIVGAAFMIFAGLLAGRKQVPHWRLGSAQFWLRGHIWLGTLSLPFILYHSGFGLGGRLEQVLWFFFIMVIGSGFFGLLMQHLLPKLLLVQIPRETFLSQLPYVKQRTRLLCDKLVSQDCGKIPLPPSDPMCPQITELGEHAVEVKQAPKDKQKGLKERWQERLQSPTRLLFVELAKYAKAEKWIAREDDFTQQMLEIYAIPGVNDDDNTMDDLSVSRATEMIATVRASLTGQTAITGEGASTAARKLSALEQMKLKKAARDAEQASSSGGALNEPAPADESALELPSELDIDAPPKPLSPLEQMKAKAAAKKAADAAPAAQGAAAAPEKKLSPLELMKQQAAAKKAAAGGAPSSDSTAAPAPVAENTVEPPKKLSPLELMKQQAATKKAALASGAPAEGATPLKQVEPAPSAAPVTENTAEPPMKLSPLELMKQQAAAKKAAAEAAQASEPAPSAAPVAETTSEPPKKLSPLELMKQQAAAKKAAAEAAQSSEPAPSAVPVTEPTTEPPKKLSPLELMKQQAAAKKAAAEAAQAPEPAPSAAPVAETTSEPPKKLSPLELMKQQAAAKKAAADAAPTSTPPAASTAEAAPAKPLSPLEQMKAKAAAAKAGSSEPAAGAPAATPAASAKPLSPLEMMKAKAGAGAAAPAVAKPAAAPVAAPVIVTKQAVNAPLHRTDELRQFYVTMLRPFLNGDGRTGRFANPNDSKREFARMRDILPVELHDSLAALEIRCDEHRQFTQLERIHHWLHYWLMLHIPFSIALLALFVVHVIVALRVVPW